MYRADAATLTAWQRRWNAIKLAAYAELAASYTPEQRAIIARMTAAGRNERLCKSRRKAPDGWSGLRHVAWPEEPPE